jgi:tetratricopeptide (TPR) repeat protein
MQTSDDEFGLVGEYVRLTHQQMKDHDPTLLFGQVMIDIGQYGKAAVFFQNLLKSSDVGVDSRADILNSLGYVFLKQERITEAHEKIDAAHKVRTKSLKPFHPDIGRSLINLSHLMYAEKRYQDALTQYMLSWKNFLKLKSITRKYVKFIQI